MRLSFILLCVISRVSLEIHAVHNLYMRKEKSNSPSIVSGYVYNQINNQPPKNITFANKGGGEKKIWDEEKSEKIREKSLIPSTTENTEIAEVKKKLRKRNVMFDEHDPSNFVQTYKKNILLGDEEDVRTELSISNDGWPYFYHISYEYDPMKFYNEIEKAEDKLFVIPGDRVIPVHEHIKDDTINSHTYSTPEIIATDNPVHADQPFFSYVLNDYFDKSDDDDPATFRGLSWGKEFDQEMSFYDIDDYAKRIRRLEEDLHSHKKNDGGNTEINQVFLPVNHQSDSYDSIQEFNENTHKNKNKQNSDSYNNYNGENKRGFKNFADYFASRFGSEDINNILTRNVVNNFDRGEKKKGTRNVYHKDEYQEETEFHDNNDKKGDYENKGQSKIRIGGSEAFLNSKARAAAGSDKSRIDKNINDEDLNFLRNNNLLHRNRNYDIFCKYRDVAKTAAIINNADYIDRFMN